MPLDLHDPVRAVLPAGNLFFQKFLVAHAASCPLQYKVRDLACQEINKVQHTFHPLSILFNKYKRPKTSLFQGCLLLM
jgi:hypothetical protein